MHSVTFTMNYKTIESMLSSFTPVLTGVSRFSITPWLMKEDEH